MTGENLRTIQVFKDIFSENGIKGFYKGATIRMAYLCVGGFAFFGMYEQLKLKLGLMIA
jgi:hypothetical protein